MSSTEYHIPVLLEQTIELLVHDRDGNYMDGTLGGGGHSKKILETLSDKGFLLGVDRDQAAIDHASELLGGYSNFKTANISFGRVNELEDISFGLRFDGILLDLGVSSKQIDDAERGFSYSSDGELDMRMDREDMTSAFEIVNSYSEKELAEIFFKYGEENRSRTIAQRIIERREREQIKTTSELADIISTVVSGKYRVKTLSRIFQALRIEVNNELKELEQILNFSLEVLNPKGRVAVISYHSLEDRIVKQFITENSTGCKCPPNFPKCVCGNKPVIVPVTKKPVVPGEEEIRENPRSRSAKLRVYEKI